MKYSMKKPNVPVYPLDDFASINFSPKNDRSDSDEVQKGSVEELTYPDFLPWKDHTQLGKNEEPAESRKADNTAYLNKGYFEVPQVTNEYYSGRNLISATVFLSTENCGNVIRELSQHLANAYQTRNESINRIRSNSNHFKIPQKVTLTAAKKESWLRDLGNSRISLQKIGEKIPHGIRNKHLIEAVISHHIPIKRALWFTKCVMFGELLALRKKHHSRISMSGETPQPNDVTGYAEKYEIHWLQEWTQQVVDYIFRLSKEMATTTSMESKELYMEKVKHFLDYVQSLYVESLLDKTIFLMLIIKPLKEHLSVDSEILKELSRIEENKDDEDEEKCNGDKSLEPVKFNFNYESRLTSLTLIKMFWNDLIKIDFLAKELSESVLLNYYFISKLTEYSQWALPTNVKSSILKVLGDTVLYLFKFNTNMFVIPNNWRLTESALTNILTNNLSSMVESEREKLLDQLELVRYRNESLILNLRKTEMSNQSYDVRQKYTHEKDVCDELRIIRALDILNLSDDFSRSLTPSSKNWWDHLKTAMVWCISPWRYCDPQSENISIICNFLKKQLVSVDKSMNKMSKAEFGNEILEILYQLTEASSDLVDRQKLNVLVNELYQLRLITIASYIRKLIANGVFSGNPDEELSYTTKVHLNVLKNLPSVNNNQCDSILKKWDKDQIKFHTIIETSKNLLQTEILDKIFHNNFIHLSQSFKDHTSSLKTGVKFLLINWITKELKSKFDTTSKLIHITPNVLNGLYEFYSISDNLAVFFKSVVSAILRNEGGILIYYLDGLYFIARLIMRHFKLIKQFPENSNNSLAINLLRLIIQNYKDLNGREFSSYNFHQVWEFIDSVIDKDGSKTQFKKRKLNNFINQNNHATKEYEPIESPMQINTIDLSFKESESKTYTTSNFRNDLDQLKNQLYKPLTDEELQELNITDLDLMSNLYHWNESLETIPEAKEMAIAKLIKNEAAHDYIATNDKLHLFVTKLLESDGNKSLMIKKLIAYDIMTFKSCLNLIQQSTSSTSVILDLLLGDYEEPKQDSALSQLFKISRYFFQARNKQIFASTLSRCLTDDKLFEKFEQNILFYLRHRQSYIDKSIFSEIFKNFEKEKIINILNRMLKRDEFNYIYSIDELGDSLCQVNGFNIMIYQFLIAQLTLGMERMSPEEIQFQWKSFVTKFMNICVNKSDHGAILVELFDCVSWNHKNIILEIFENEFMTQISKEDLDQTNSSKTIDYFFQKFLNYSIGTVETSRLFIQNLMECLNRLEHEILTQSYGDSTTLAISSILKVLIIHKPTLCSFVARNIFDELVSSFIRSLVNLLNLLKYDDKIKILFYDLLFLIKSSITEEINTITDHQLEQSQNSVDDFKTIDTPNMSKATHFQQMFELPELNKENPFEDDLDEQTIFSSSTTQEDELKYGGDLNYFNDRGLKLQLTKHNSLDLSPFVGNILDNNEKLEEESLKNLRTVSKPFKLRSYEILEDTSHSINDACINLSLFDAYLTKENIP
ncbi:SRB8 [Candida pseudojiufengensis]|uniref:SRB8 n=1 Tax=Candida pseudojiufengensis TaxID=497109 RepID=UPI0022251B13|nr:SRB8 [Candida pseudojiufengensis]KAI5965554.1 SRB8 [Candida pseudojiufengensis]